METPTATRAMADPKHIQLRFLQQLKMLQLLVLVLEVVGQFHVWLGRLQRPTLKIWTSSDKNITSKLPKDCD